ncbi:MAG: acyltransferase [Candidatus Magasanikbacteria bacterium]|jgi:peptidoglycan/LPS O-acetylase OafA/YrhL|nr:acyltransferase [Candidatus Magasanikbacteria bacterium]MBT4071148.1 acyltransferase [Candidatus Magasanikbacteria bacterium]
MNKIGYLESLRGIATLMVVLNHFVVGFYPSLYTGALVTCHIKNCGELFIIQTPLFLLYAGNFAVCIFFILSGYVLSFKFFKYNTRPLFVIHVIKRYFRLIAPVLFSISIAYLFMKLGFFYNKEAALLTKSNWWLGTFWNFEPNFFEMIRQSFIGVFFQKQISYNTLLWTMYYEFFGSILVFSIIFLFRKMTYRFLVYIIMIFWFINTYYLAFILGMALSDLYNNKPDLFKKYSNKFSIGLFFILGFFFAAYPKGFPVDNTMYSFLKLETIDSAIFYHIVGAFFVMLFLLMSQKIQKILSAKSLIYIGRLSFSIYVIHLIVIASFSSYIFPKFLNYFSYHMSFFITFICSLLLILVCSRYIYKYVDEKFGMRLSKKVYTYLNHYIKF